MSRHANLFILTLSLLFFYAGASGCVSSSAQGDRASRSETEEVGDYCSKRDIRAVVQKHKASVSQCHAEAQSDASKKESVLMRWTITSDGSVRNVRIVSTDSESDATKACIIEVVKAYQFEPPRRGVCRVDYTLF